MVCNKLLLYTKQKIATLQPPPPFRLCQKKNNPKLFNITCCYASSLLFKAFLIFFGGRIATLCKIAAKPTHRESHRTLQPHANASGLSWFLQSTFRIGFPFTQISRTVPPQYKAVSSNEFFVWKKSYWYPPKKVLAVHSLHLHYISLTLSLRYSNATFHFGFVHFTPNSFCTHANNPFQRYCSFQLCAILNWPLLFSCSHRYPTAQAKNHASPQLHACQPFWSCCTVIIVLFMFFGTPSF